MSMATGRHGEGGRMQETDMRDRKAQREEQDEEIRRSLARISNVILVMSGKGGVGKSCVSVSIAVGLADRGYRVGLMDVDLHGPSIPQMLGLAGTHEIRREKPETGRGAAVTFADGKIVPARFCDSLSVVSIECMLESIDSAVIWRGPMKIGAIRQFIADVRWDDLDYLVIDSPPGTGDEPLTVAQTIPNARALIVTTPQDVSLRDVRKSITFCRQVSMKIVGLIENMSGLVCPHCGGRVDVFKTGGGERTAREMNVAFLGSIPIITEVVTACDDGIPAIRASRRLRESFEPILSRIAGNEIKPLEHTTHETNDTKEARVKIAIPLAQGKLCMHFGHSEEFALIEVDEQHKEILRQESIPAPEHQPGLLPRWLHDRGANVIISGGMGSRAQSLFSENGIRVVTGAPAEEPSKIAMDYLNGRLVSGGNVCDH